MRVSSLSDDRVIRLISQYFVPTWLSRDRYQLEKPSREEQLLIGAIDLDRRRKKLEGGAVCVYIVTAKGEVLATLPVQKACKPDLLTPFLEKVIDKEKFSPREAKAARASAAPPPDKPKPKSPEGLVFTIRSRFDDPRVNRGLSQDRVELSKEEWSAFLPKGQADVGHAFPVSKATASKLLMFAYPPLPHWGEKLAKIEEQSLTAKVTHTDEKELHLRLEGNLALVYPAKGLPTDGKVTARLLGFATVDKSSRKLTALVLISEEGRYVWHWEGKAQPKEMSFSIELEP